MIAGLTHADKIILNAIQYEFQPVENPYGHISGKLGLDTEALIRKLRRFYELGHIRRVGYTFNFRTANLVGALIGFELPKEKIDAFSKFSYSLPNVTHNYLRSHSKYNVWFTIKDKSIDDLVEKVEGYAEKFKAKDYVILKSRRTCKLSIKYDLERGISWSKPRLLDSNPPKLNEFDIDLDFIKYLRNLPLDLDPYREIKEAYNMKTREILGLIDEMIERGVITDYGAYLDGEKIGFSQNAMVTFDGNEDIAIKVAKEVPETSHVVLREVIFGDWRDNVYFMIHGTRRDVIDVYIDVIMDSIGIDKFQKLYSIKNLKVRR
jgi:DNA-binding Lrp family transcriptional regulator